MHLRHLADDFVTTEDGTGIVHLAPAFGEDDYRVAAAAPRVPFDATRAGTLYNPVLPDGTYDASVLDRDGRSLQGRFVKDPELTAQLIEDLSARGLLLRVADYEHSYPHCWRCGTPLLYYAKPSWYIATSNLREELLAANETVSWHPPHVKEGRFGDWLKNNVDWALSRERYWGTPLPVWRCPSGHIHVVSSFAELAERSGSELEDHHRPYVDDISFPCPHGGCAEQMRRVPEVIDVWFDSGAMPFAQHHFPFENQDVFEQSFPADFICEAQDQTRGWFYSLLAVATLLERPAPYRNVVCLGLILDEDGQKMSKSKGNTVEPWQVLDTYGADAFRWYFFTSKQPWDGYRFSAETIGEGVRLFLKQLWSTYYFYALYARAAEGQLAGQGTEPARRATWTAGRCRARRARPSTSRSAWTPTTPPRPAGRSQPSWTSSPTGMCAARGVASGTATRRRSAHCAHVCWPSPRCSRRCARSSRMRSTTTSTASCPSVHLCDFPRAADIGAIDGDLEQAMELARETVRLGLGARGKAKIKVRQPLGEAVVVADGRERAAIERLSDVVRDELNVRRVRFVEGAEELSSYELKANYRTLGPLFGSEMPAAAAAIAALDAGHVARILREGGEIGISVSGREHALSADDLLLSMQAPDGYSVEREGAHAVALDLAIDEDLLRDGRSREIVHAVQNARKNAGLQVEDRILLALDGDRALMDAAGDTASTSRARRWPWRCASARAPSATRPARPTQSRPRSKACSWSSTSAGWTPG